MEPNAYDFIVVGGGLAGLVLAARLSDVPDFNVVVIEAGEDQSADPRTSVPAMGPTLVNSSADWCFRTVPQEGFDNREISFPQGRLLGGSSALNGLSFTPTSKANVDGWCSLGNPGWDWESFSKSLAKAYRLPSGAPPGDDGALRLSYPDDTDTIWPKAWADSVRDLGFTTQCDPFTGTVCGALTNAECIDPSTKQRMYSANAYLGPARERKNLTVLTQATVDKILFRESDHDGGIVTEGVQYTKDGETRTVTASKEVILTAGTINSPKLLELSGVGGADRLRKLGIDVAIDNPHVGENLQNHPICTMSFEVLDDLWTMDSLARQDPSTLAAAMEAYEKQSGPFATSGTTATAQLPFPGIQTSGAGSDLDELLERHIPPASNNTTTTAAHPGFADAHEKFVQSILRSPLEASGCYFSFPGYAFFNGDGSMAPPPPGSDKYFSIALLLAHPLSRGSVHITSSDASSPGIEIDPRYLSHPLDIEVLARHLRNVESIARAKPLSERLKPDGKRNPEAPLSDGFANLEQAKDYLRKTAVGAHHFTGTCSMMSQDLGGVVNPQLQVYGCSNLRVCDASIIPLTPRTNPQATVYGVAEHAAKFIKSAHGY